MFRTIKTYVALLLIPQYFLVTWLGNNPDFVERFYSLGFYPVISKFFRYTLGWLPFSFGDLVYAIAIVYLFRWFFVNFKRLKTDTIGWFVDVFSAVSVVYFAFHVFWGFNYYRLPLHTSLNLKPDYTTEQLVRVTKKLIAKSNALHSTLADNDSMKIDIPYSKREILNLAPLGYHNLKNTFPDLDYYPKSAKKSMFSYPLTYMGFSGYLNPLTNEAQIDALIPKYLFPTTTLHEMAHQLGYAAENEANFIGCLAAINHDDTYFKYTGYTFALRFCLNEIANRDEVLFKSLVKTTNKGILMNFKEARDFWDGYENPLEPLFKKTYSSYLKANKQAKGMESYSYVVALIINYFDNSSLKK